MPTLGKVQSHREQVDRSDRRSGESQKSSGPMSSGARAWSHTISAQATVVKTLSQPSRARAAAGAADRGPGADRARAARRRGSPCSAPRRGGPGPRPIEVGSAQRLELAGVVFDVVVRVNDLVGTPEGEAVGRDEDARPPGARTRTTSASTDRASGTCSIDWIEITEAKAAVAKRKRAHVGDVGLARLIGERRGVDIDPDRLPRGEQLVRVAGATAEVEHAAGAEQRCTQAVLRPVALEARVESALRGCDTLTRDHRHAGDRTVTPLGRMPARPRSSKRARRDGHTDRNTRVGQQCPPTRATRLVGAAAPRRERADGRRDAARAARARPSRPGGRRRMAATEPGTPWPRAAACCA